MLPQIQYDKVFLGKLKSDYFNAKALYETIKANSEEIQKKVLAENEFYETEDIAGIMKKRGGDGKPKRILDPDLTYMMDLDNELPRFIDLCYPEYVKAGIADSRGKNYIPEANAKDLLHEAEKQLVEYGIDIIPDEFGEKETLRKAVQMIKYRDKVLDLVLRLESGENAYDRDIGKEKARSYAHAIEIVRGKQMRKIVEKKILPKYFDAVIHDQKKFEIRKDEDDLEVGDAVILKEWDGKRYTGREISRSIEYILRDVPEYGLMPGYVIFGW